MNKAPAIGERKSEDKKGMGRNEKIERRNRRAEGKHRADLQTLRMTKMAIGPNHTKVFAELGV